MIDFDLTDKHLFLVRRQRVPLLQEVVGPRRHFRVLRNHAELLLVGKDPLAEIIPAFVEQVHVTNLLDAPRCRMVRCMPAAWHVVTEERFARINLVELIHPVDAIVRHRCGEVPARMPDIRIDCRRVAEQIRFSLAGVATNEKKYSKPCRSTTGRTANLVRRERGRIVVLPEPRSTIAILFQDFADGRGILRDDAVVAREISRLLGNHPESLRVMVASRDERGAGQRAQCG